MSGLLTWYRVPGVLHMANGASNDYLIVVTADRAVLTWWSRLLLPADRRAVEAVIAGQAALNAIQRGGIYDITATEDPADVRRFKDIAEAFESGQDIPDEPHWRHDGSTP